MDPTTDEFQQLLKRAAEGDSVAWRSVVEAFAPRVYGLVRAQCRDDELAEEIAQSTFCTVAAKIGSYIEGGRFESWVFRIAMNRLRDEMRRRKRQARNAGDEPLDASAARPVRRDAGVEAAESVDRLRAAMARLSEADRELVDLRHIGGMSFKALSDYFEEPVGTLLARHHRALRKLRAMLEETGLEARDLGGEER
ncbi:MAG: RNA polymerase sigma factor [Planctomycetaceae bacterium]|jgi:RNA polymerase sigma-70 factor (ECF subfamily)|nr:RNA polymerase sigma factor [Planctomycetaceae bacterium]